MRIVTRVALRSVLATLLVALAAAFAVLVDARAPDHAYVAAPAGGQVVELVVHSARDCKYCVRWMSPSGGKDQFESWARTHPGTQLFIVERASVAGNETPGDYPDNLKWLSEQNQSHQRLRPGTPMFEVFIARKLVLRSYGLDSWDEEIFPAIKELDARRLHTRASVE